MTNINLATSDLPQKQERSYRKGIISIVVILAVLFGGYGWLLLEAGKVESEIKTVNENYLVEYQKLTDSNKEIIDFQNRITLAKNLLAEENAAYSSLPELEKNLLPGTYIRGYALDGGKLTLGITANSFDILARQIASFKRNPYFSSVSVGKSSLGENSKVVSEIVLNVN